MIINNNFIRLYILKIYHIDFLTDLSHLINKCFSDCLVSQFQRFFSSSMVAGLFFIADQE